VTTAGNTGSGEFTPGDVTYRVVNLLAVPVDLYARTQGFVEAYPLQIGLDSLTVSEFYAPPENGRFLVTQAGATDVTCVSSCTEFIGEFAPYPDDGPVHTVVVYDVGDGPKTFDLWEQALPPSQGNANAMAPADASAGLAIVTAIALTNSDFGLRFGWAGVDGCHEPVNLAGVLVGGNQTPAYVYGGNAAGVVLFPNDDRDCAGAPVGGTFNIYGGAGTRTHVILYGEPENMSAVVLPMAGDETAAADAEANPVYGEAASGDPAVRDAVIAAMAEGLAREIDLTPAQAACASEYVVDALGLDVVAPGGVVVDFDSLGDAEAEIAGDALVAAVVPCGIDPSVLG
ncbi:MAG TPA: hypothetical protein PLV68_05225, partial [Ilumatobacteraceae bacterium]|nr:hypothetical protein [Ilumatobacteraceae bacterium]